MHIVHAWQLEETQRKAENADRRLYELDALSSNVDRLECQNRELSSCVDDLRATCEALLERIEQLEGQLNESL